MRLRGFGVTNAQLGWVSDCCFKVETARQFCDEQHTVREGHRWMLVAVLKSYLAARRLARQLAARPGEREANGWS